MQTETGFDAPPDHDEMVLGLRGLSELIDREVPTLVELGDRPILAGEVSDFTEVARCLSGVEHGLDGLWPEED